MPARATTALLLVLLVLIVAAPAPAAAWQSMAELVAYRARACPTVRARVDWRAPAQDIVEQLADLVDERVTRVACLYPRERAALLCEAMKYLQADDRVVVALLGESSPSELHDAARHFNAAPTFFLSPSLDAFEYGDDARPLPNECLAHPLHHWVAHELVLVEPTTRRVLLSKLHRALGVGTHELLPHASDVGSGDEHLRSNAAPGAPSAPRQRSAPVRIVADTDAAADHRAADDDADIDLNDPAAVVAALTRRLEEAFFNADDDGDNDGNSQHAVVDDARIVAPAADDNAHDQPLSLAARVEPHEAVLGDELDANATKHNDR